MADVIRTEPEAFEPKDRWAMDWYYPVLGGALSARTAKARLAEVGHVRHGRARASAASATSRG